MFAKNNFLCQEIGNKILPLFLLTLWTSEKNQCECCKSIALVLKKTCVLFYEKRVHINNATNFKWNSFFFLLILCTNHCTLAVMKKTPFVGTIQSIFFTKYEHNVGSTQYKVKCQMNFVSIDKRLPCNIS